MLPFSASNRHLQLTVQPNSTEADSEVWVLLTRHQVVSARNSEYIALHVYDQDEGQRDINKIAANVGVRWQCSVCFDHKLAYIQARYTNSTHVLVRNTRSAHRKSNIIDRRAGSDKIAPGLWGIVNFSLVRRTFRGNRLHHHCILFSDYSME